MFCKDSTAEGNRRQKVHISGNVAARVKVRTRAKASLRAVAIMLSLTSTRAIASTREIAAMRAVAIMPALVMALTLLLGGVVLLQPQRAFAAQTGATVLLDTHEVTLEQGQKDFNVAVSVDAQNAYAGAEFSVVCANGIKVNSVSYSASRSSAGPVVVAGQTWFSFFSGGNDYSGKVTATLNLSYQGGENSSILLNTVDVYSKSGATLSKEELLPRETVIVKRAGANNVVPPIEIPDSSGSGGDGNGDSASGSNAGAGTGANAGSGTGSGTSSSATTFTPVGGIGSGTSTGSGSGTGSGTGSTGNSSLADIAADTGRQSTGLGSATGSGTSGTADAGNNLTNIDAQSTPLSESSTQGAAFVAAAVLANPLFWLLVVVLAAAASLGYVFIVRRRRANNQEGSVDNGSRF